VVGASPSGKTKIVAVKSMDDSPLGHIKWYAPWRKYAFQPDWGTIFEADCLGDIAAKCTEMTTRHKLEAKQALEFARKAAP
jgi:hypothetical protein